MRAMRKGDSCGTISYLLPLSLLMGQPRRTHTGFSRGVVFRSHAGAEPHYGRRAAGSLHLLSACGHQPDPSWRRVHQRCGGRLHLGHPAEHSRSAFKHRHAVRRISDGQAGTSSGSPLHRFCKLPYRRRIRRAGHDPVLPPDG